jgi:NADPH:quinone reductase-like Zn-dependent oxidoreductase
MCLRCHYEHSPLASHLFACAQGADGALDSVGGQVTRQLTSSLKHGGTVLVYGAMSGFTGEFDIGALLSKDVTVKVCIGVKDCESVTSTCVQCEVR